MLYDPMHVEIDKEVIAVANQRKFNLASIFHVRVYFLLQCVWKLCIFAQFPQYLHNFLRAVMQNHSGIQGEFSYFVFVDHFRSVDWLTERDQVGVYFLVEWALREYQYMMVRQN